jgi:methyl-accepting chemotaxis protein
MGFEVNVKTYQPQPEEVLMDYFNDLRNYDALRKARPEIDPRAYRALVISNEGTVVADEIIKSSDSVLNKFETIDREVKTVSEQEQNIRSAMEEQEAGSKQILEAIDQLNEATQMVKGSSTEMLEGSKQVTQEITNRMNEMVSGADHVNAAVSRVNEISVTE